MINILGINISTLSKIDLKNKLTEFIHSGQHYIATVNPEIILTAHRDEEYFYVLNKADLAPADGFGLVLAGLLADEKIPRITGADLTPELLDEAEQNSWPVSILNWHKGLSSASDIREILNKRWPNLKFQIIDLEREIYLPEEFLYSLNKFSPKLLFCTFGAPFQEKVIYHNLNKIPSIGLAIGVGGAFDFLTKKAIRAPRSFQRLGLEWLWRLIKQPRRLKRIWQATAVFFWKIILWRFINPHRYRKNVSCMMLRKGFEGWEVLIVERQESPGHWQLPQGGTDGEPVEAAGTREIREETNIHHIKILGVLKNAYKYRFPDGMYRGITTGSPKHYDYCGQSQSFLLVEMLDLTEEIKIDFWDHRAFRFVPLENLLQEIHPSRKEAMKIFIDFAKKILK
ncbi:MAG: WecB/TagA/CpsF family glycosyltransferase [Patescibacteria group bacterium]